MMKTAQMHQQSSVYANNHCGVSVFHMHEIHGHKATTLSEHGMKMEEEHTGRKSETKGIRLICPVGVIVAYL